jgi:hypothetical protein
MLLQIVQRALRHTPLPLMAAVAGLTGRSKTTRGVSLVTGDWITAGGLPTTEPYSSHQLFCTSLTSEARGSTLIGERNCIRGSQRWFLLYLCRQGMSYVTKCCKNPLSSYPMCTRYDLNGTVLTPFWSPGLAAATAVAALASNEGVAWNFIDTLWRMPIPSGDDPNSDRYFSGSLYLEALLILSGKYRAWL